MNTLGITMKCIKGEVWPTTEFKCFVQATDDPLTQKSITFHCPINHKFTLEQAIQQNIFTPEQAQKILNSAKKSQKEFQNRDWSVFQPSDFLENKEVMAAKLSCVKCGKPAKRVLGKREEWEKFALCFECLAAWHNYDKKTFDLLDKTHGRPWNLFWEAIFKRFLKNLPSLDQSGAEKLLEECRKIAKKSRKVNLK